MSFMARIDTLDPRTVLNIRNGSCNCIPGMLRDSRWSICDYHEGYDAALEQHGALLNPQGDAG